MVQPQLPDELRITIVGTSALPDTTRAAFRTVIIEHGKSLLNEAQRLATGNSEEETPMITPTLIMDTSKFMLRGYIQKKPSKYRGMATLIGGITTFAGGVFVNNVDKGWGVAGFCACVVVVAICIIWGIEK
ncbi:hypothetical protein [Actinomadura sp. NTSP31]|uniref:hypothetical protein n=1 Tax=Actinomadura sp. NTSP31 TaxID=1735447 RepID=UPI0035C220ED